MNRAGSASNQTKAPQNRVACRQIYRPLVLFKTKHSKDRRPDLPQKVLVAHCHGGKRKTLGIQNFHVHAGRVVHVVREPLNQDECEESDCSQHQNQPQHPAGACNDVTVFGFVWLFTRRFYTRACYIPWKLSSRKITERKPVSKQI